MVKELIEKYKPVLSYIDNIVHVIDKMATQKVASSSRYFGFKEDGSTTGTNLSVCFNSISRTLSEDYKGLAVAYAGYGGCLNGEPFRWLEEAELSPHLPNPCRSGGDYHYGDYSRQWLEMLLEKDGPFETVTSKLLTRDPDEIQAMKGFIWPDVTGIDGRLLWCFCIASRIGVFNGLVLWTFLHMRKAGYDLRMSALVAEGFAPQVRKGADGKLGPTGKYMKTYRGGFLGLDVSAYAHRWLAATPDINPEKYIPRQTGTNGSSQVFNSGDRDDKRQVFEDIPAVVSYLEARSEEQASAINGAKKEEAAA